MRAGGDLRYGARALHRGRSLAASAATAGRYAPTADSQWKVNPRAIVSHVAAGLAALLGCEAPQVSNSRSNPTSGYDGSGGSPVDPVRADAGSFVLPDAGPIAPDMKPTAECGRLMAVVRDFRASHPDFEKQSLNVARLFPGVVRPELGPDNKPVYAHPGPTATTSGPLNFDQWYRDVPGANLRFDVPLMLTQQRPGVFAYDNQAFFPVDRRGWPNEERFGHNFHFTTEIHTTFRYKGGEQFTFTGDDDVFVFINRRLALDLGGLHPTLSQTVNLDAQAATLGLAVGGSYPLDVFHAERHTTQSTFRIETSIECLTVSVE